MYSGGEKMLFRKKEYMNWDQYNNIISEIEHWCFVSNRFSDYLGEIK